MALLKLKAMAAAVFTACALGFGAFAATGAGIGDGPGHQTQGTPLASVAAKPADSPAKPIVRLEKPASDLDLLQGSWHVAGVDEELGDENAVPQGYMSVPKDVWVVEISGDMMKMPHKDANGGWKRREYKIAVDVAKNPKPIPSRRSTACSRTNTTSPTPYATYRARKGRVLRGGPSQTALTL